MAYETIDFKAAGPLARITLNRPERLNSFTAQMHGELRDALDNLGEARVVVLSGAGRGFALARTLMTGPSRPDNRSTLDRLSRSFGIPSFASWLPCRNR